MSTIQEMFKLGMKRDVAALLDPPEGPVLNLGAGNHPIPGAINIPVDELRDRLSELPDGDLIVHCAVGVRGHTASRILHAAGRRSLNLDGGYRTWEAATA